VGKERVRKLMQLYGIRAQGKRRFKLTTDSKHGLPVAPNLLDRQFNVAEPDKVGAMLQHASCLHLGPLLVRHARTIARTRHVVTTVIAGRLPTSAHTPGDRQASVYRRRPRFNQTVAALCPRGRIASKFAITIHQSNLTKSLKIS
jgi:transposase InsO family protein